MVGVSDVNYVKVGSDRRGRAAGKRKNSFRVAAEADGAKPYPMLEWPWNDRFRVLGRQYGAVNLSEHFCRRGPKNQLTKPAGVSRHNDQIDLFGSGYIHNILG
jgi:hypothetical protein